VLTYGCRNILGAVFRAGGIAAARSDFYGLFRLV
jgi:hypothetical protein